MAVTPLLRIQVDAAAVANRATGYFINWVCDLESELPSTNVVNGDFAITFDTHKQWQRSGGVWVAFTGDSIAVWGNITGTLSNQTDLQSALDAKQDDLVSGTNIKTINGSSVLGSGDLVVSGSAAWGSITGTLSSQTDLQAALDAKQATLVSATNIKTINGASVLGSGDLSVSAGDPAYAQGTFTVATGTAKILSRKLILTSTQRATLSGTATLRIG